MYSIVSTLLLSFILESFIMVKKRKRKWFPVSCSFTNTRHPTARKDKVPFNVCGHLNGTIDIKGDRIDEQHFHSFFLNVLDIQPEKSPKLKNWSHVNHRATSELALAQRWSSRP